MDRDKEHINIIDAEVKKYEGTDRSAVVFGAGRAGWYAIKVLEHYGISIAGVIDNNEAKQGTSFLGYPVGSCADYSMKSSGLTVYPALFTPEKSKLVEAQLGQDGYGDVVNIMDSFLFTFMIEVAGRNCDRRKLAESIDILFESYREDPNKCILNSENHYVSPTITSYITQRCSLQCRDCGALIPYYRSPVDFSVAEVMRDLEKYAKAFDVVPEISFCGGEPFMHPDFHVICEETAKIPNVIFINLNTNGTIVPSEDKLERIAACGVDIHQSDYGKLSKKQGDLFSCFDRHSIYHDINFVHDNQMWSSLPTFKKQNRPSVENDKKYLNCVAQPRICCQLMAGELHRCTFSLNGTHQGLIADNPGDYVKLHDASMSDEQVTEAIRSFLLRETSLDVCDCCGQNSGWVAPAIQLEQQG